MYKHILVALDGRPASEQALKQAVALAHQTGADLTGLSIIEHLPAYAASVGEVDEVIQETERFFHRVQENAQKVARIAGVALTTLTRKGNAAQTIVRYAVENGVDLIVVGAESHRGLGSTADKVTENAPCSVLVARIDLPSIRVKDVMTKEVFAIAPATPLAQVVKAMLDGGYKATPVVEEGKVVGIITGGDLLARAGMDFRLSIQRILPEPLVSEQIRKLSAAGKTARDIMTTPVVTLAEGESVARAVQLMSDRQVKRLPVVDDQGALVGIISRMDILALAASWDLSSEIFPDLTRMSPRTAADIMSREVPTVAPDTPLGDVINQIVATPLRRVVVVDERQRVMGIIVDTNLIKAARSERPGAMQNLLSIFSAPASGIIRWTGQACDVMDRNVFTVHGDTPLQEVIQLMIAKRIKRLVVTDLDNHLLGMVSRERILHMLVS